MPGLPDSTITELWCPAASWQKVHPPVKMSPRFGDTVITSRPEPIRRFVTETLGRTATQQDATGVYTGEPRTMIMVALTRRQAGLLRDFLRREDPEAF